RDETRISRINMDFGVMFAESTVDDLSLSLRCRRSGLVGSCSCQFVKSVSPALPKHGSIRSRQAFLENYVTLEYFASVDSLEPSEKVRAFSRLGWFWHWRGGEQRDDPAPLGDTDRLTIVNPVQNTPEIVPQLSNRCRFHV